MSSLATQGFPFDSSASDRLYSASVFRDYFLSFFNDGVIPEQEDLFEVEAQTTPDNTVKINKGRVLIQGAMYELTPADDISIPANASGNPRIDRIILRLNYGTRTFETAILQGTPGVSPVAPALTQDGSMWEFSLAQIAVANGFTTISNSDITDERDFCNFNIISKLKSEANANTAYTLQITDLNKFILANNASAITYTIPPDTDELFPIDSEITIMKYGAGNVIFSAGAGVTIRSSDSSVIISNQYQVATLKKIGTNEWWLGGALT